MSGFTRGFLGRHKAERDPRLPPGQYDVGNDFPVLSAEVTPRLETERWTMSVDGLVASPQTWTWAGLLALPESEFAGDIHCVTSWSKLDTRFAGVSVDILLDAAEPLPEATHVLATSTTGYTTNLPLEHVRGGQAWVVWAHEGKPLHPEHGGPLRLLVPHLYFWKSAKWVTGLTLLDHDQQGFWERNGYHDLGDPWHEQRYQATDRRAPAGGWRRATVREVTHPTPRGVMLRLEAEDRVEHMAGQHYVIRLRAPDGYIAQRSYSVASPPSDPLCEFFVEELNNGEVSTYLAQDVMVGDVLDVRGPIGGWFVWDGSSPALGMAGGTGVVPLVSMLRHAQTSGRADLLRLVVSARTMAELPYADELIAAGAFIALTRETGPSGRPAGRLSATEIASRVVSRSTCYVCGSASFAEAVSSQLVDAGVDASLIKIERFGPSG